MISFRLDIWYMQSCRTERQNLIEDRKRKSDEWEKKWRCKRKKSLMQRKKEDKNLRRNKRRWSDEWEKKWRCKRKKSLMQAKKELEEEQEEVVRRVAEERNSLTKLLYFSEFYQKGSSNFPVQYNRNILNGHKKFRFVKYLKKSL